MVRREDEERPSRGLAERRRFLQGGAAAAGFAALAGFGGRALQRSRYDVTAERAKVSLPPPAEPVPTRSARRRPRQERRAVADPVRRLLPHRHRDRRPADRAGDVEAAHPRHGRSRAHAGLRRAEEAADDRTLDHAVLRVQPGRRAADQQRALAGHPAGRPAARGRHPGRRRSAADDLDRRLHLRRADQGRHGRTGLAARDRHERRHRCRSSTASRCAWSCPVSTATSRPASGSSTSTRPRSPNGPTGCRAVGSPVPCSRT